MALPDIMFIVARQLVDRTHSWEAPRTLRIAIQAVRLEEHTIIK